MQGAHSSRAQWQCTSYLHPFGTLQPGSWHKRDESDDEAEAEPYEDMLDLTHDLVLGEAEPADNAGPAAREHRSDADTERTLADVAEALQHHVEGIWGDRLSHSGSPLAFLVQVRGASLREFLCNRTGHR